MLTQKIKQKLYRSGSYLIPAPATTTEAWGEDDWIKFIDIRGAWSFTYYEINGELDGSKVVPFGSYDKNDCIHELDSEKHSWRAEGIKKLKVVTTTTCVAPDPEVYPEFYND